MEDRSHQMPVRTEAISFNDPFQTLSTHRRPLTITSPVYITGIRINLPRMAALKTNTRNPGCHLGILKENTGLKKGESFQGTVPHENASMSCE